jgi:hypothetical protein
VLPLCVMPHTLDVLRALELHREALSSRISQTLTLTLAPNRNLTLTLTLTQTVTLTRTLDTTASAPEILRRPEGHLRR